MTSRTISIKELGAANFDAALLRPADIMARTAEAIYEAFLRRILRVLSRSA